MDPKLVPNRNAQSTMLKSSSDKYIKRQFEDCFTLVPGKEGMLGEGSFGTTVRRARENDTQEEVAVKCMKLRNLSFKARDDAKNEISMLKELNHPSIIHMHCSFQTRDHIFIVSDLVRGGDLFDQLVECGSFSEKASKRILRPLVGAIKYLHELDIVHRDVKLENILVNEQGTGILCDFGFAKKLKTPQHQLKTDCGTENYAAPEILMGRAYGKGVDVWALGIVMFMIVSGYHPFRDGSSTSLYSRVCSGKVILERDIWDNLSKDVYSLVMRMLTVDIAKRATIQEVYSHCWLEEELSESISSLTISPSVISNKLRAEEPT